jgi:ARG/rhodanese/phosphatase superfamily protein
MRHAIGPFAISLFLATASADTPKAPDNALDDKAALLAPIQVDSLTLTPIVVKDDKSVTKDDMIVLDEAMAAKQVSIKEQGEGSVNNLTLTNKADKPLFLLAGEVIIGGKQDRIIGRNTVVPAKSTLEVPVYCVEHGRWTGVSKDFSSAKALAHADLRGKASYEDQQQVWKEVAEKNAKRGTESDSGTYRKVAQQQADGSLAGGSVATMEKQVNDALAKIPAADRAKMIGYAVSLNGQVATVDRFGSPQLFKKLETKLVRSYLTEAVDIKAKKDIKPPKTEEVKAFMFDADQAEEKPSYDTNASSTKINMGKKAYKAKVEDKAAPPAAAPVYQNYQAH